MEHIYSRDLPAIEKLLIKGLDPNYHDEKSGGNLTSIKFEDILHSPRSPGRIFLLSEKELLSRLSSIEEISEGQIIWSETAGIQQLSKTQRYKAHKLLEKWSFDYE